MMTNGHHFTVVSKTTYPLIGATLLAMLSAAGCTVKSSDDSGASKGGSHSTDEGGSGGQDVNTDLGGAAGSKTASVGGQGGGGGTLAAGGTQSVAGGGNASTHAGAAGTSVLATGGATSGGGSAGQTSAAAAGQAGTTVSGSNPCSAADPGNDTREQSTPYDLGATYVACLQTGTDVDFYEFTAPTSPVAGGVVQVSLVDVGTTGSVESTSYAVSDNGEIENAYATTGTNVYYWFGVAAGSKYRISVYRFSSGTAAVPYILKTAFVPVNDVHEPNDVRTAAKPITTAADVQGYFFAGYKVSTGFETNAWEDWYKVTLAAGNVTVTVDNLASDISGEVTLFNNLGSNIKGAYSSAAGSTVVLTQTAIAAGDYFLMVSPFSSKQPKGTGSVIPQYITQPYTLRVAQ